jgi:uncharacterized membrane protein
MQQHPGVSPEFKPMMVLPAPSQPAEALPTFSWFNAWRAALTRPSVATYADLLLDPRLSLRRAAAWLFTASLLAYLVDIVLQATLFPSTLVDVIREASQTGPQAYQATPTVLLIASLACTPFMAAMFLAAYLLGFALLHFIASALGSRGSYTELVYAHAAYLAPLTLLTALLGTIPVVNCLTLPLALYSFGLQLMALKAATRMTWGRVIAVLAVVAVLVVLVASVAALVWMSPEVQQWLAGSGATV